MLIKMLFPTSFYNSCSIWEAAIEIFSCKAVNHSQSADVILSWDSGIVIYVCPLCPPSGITYCHPDCQQEAMEAAQPM